MGRRSVLRHKWFAMCGVCALASSNVTGEAKADESGVSFWLADQFGSVAAAPFGDLFPQASLHWNSGVNNFMTFVMGDVPVGAYDPIRLANLGIEHGAIDGGVGYAYVDP
jgi:hypothetical protein